MVRGQRTGAIAWRGWCGARERPRFRSTTDSNHGLAITDDVCPQYKVTCRAMDTMD
jgi:hypothetical protein